MRVSKGLIDIVDHEVEGCRWPVPHLEIADLSMPMTSTTIGEAIIQVRTLISRMGDDGHF